MENVAAHYWLKELLVKAGIDESRIAVLNGETAPDPATRQRIAEGFTNEPALYDIVIANKIAYEGVNLQTRTCSIFHGDLPYEPATLQQRNGRGLRQGNRFDVIDIYYILSKRSSDMARFQLIAGKREWMSAILESAASETNNPAAQADMSPEDWLIYLSRDTEQTRALIEKKKREAAEAFLLVISRFSDEKLGVGRPETFLSAGPCVPTEKTSAGRGTRAVKAQM